MRRISHLESSRECRRGNPSLRRLFTASASRRRHPRAVYSATLLEELNDPSVAHILDRWSSMVDLETMDESTKRTKRRTRQTAELAVGGTTHDLLVGPDRLCHRGRPRSSW